MNKRFFASIIAITIIFMSVSIPTYAQDKAEKSNQSERIVSIREDVPSSIAQKDKTYNASISKKYYCQKSIMGKMDDNVGWDTWGERLYDNSRHLMAAHGYSAHMKNNTVLDTYHYTRVYFGWMRAGDSGRVWGNGKVYALGPWTDWDTADLSTLYVKYGTES
ncbi:MAG: hypothetical protein E7304_04305 [Butyrivibrio sp.]|jgi:hypothetical protein|uniref:hypothetical protein n=1 Tax=Butyrivibrio sp. TaxID=28121 RepID=UPI001EB5F92C|nr:hypothetical protein [Butyrivibrio sp.]MBE5840614.1 hypothetical protein [Butyrivibrio sp.]